MPARHPDRLPHLWMMTDERMGEGLWDALAGLPRGAGVVFRHLGTPLPERRLIFARIVRIARRRRLVLIRAGADRLPGEDGIHGRGVMRPGHIRTWPVHSRLEAVAGIRASADLLFVSPVFPTRTHPNAPTLGVMRAKRIVDGMTIPAIALGGMNARRFKRLRGLGFHGWAAIDALSSVKP